MRNFVGLLLLFCSLNVFGQSNETLMSLRDYPKGVNTIYIDTPDTITLAYQKIASALLDYGFEIEKSDNLLFYITTEFSTVGGMLFSTQIRARLKTTEAGGTRIILKGDGGSGGWKYPAANYHRKDVPNRAFAIMLEVARNYPLGAVSLGKETN